LVSVVLWAPGLSAEPLSVERPVQIAVAPSSFQVYGRLDEAPLSLTIRRSYHRGVARYLARHDEMFDIVPESEVRRRLLQGDASDTIGVAREWAELGIRNYKQLRTEEAIEQLEKAVERFERLRYGLVDPERMSDVLLYLARAYLDRGHNEARPLVLMKRMIRLDPSRRLRKGYFPDRVVDFYRSARRELLRDLRRNGPSKARGRAIADRTDSDAVFFGYVLPRLEGGYEAFLFLYTRQQDRILPPATVTLSSVESATLQRAANRMASRYAPCLYDPPEPERRTDTVVQSRGNGPFSLQLKFVYGSFLKFPAPIEKPFGHLGFGAAGHLRLTEEFGIDLEFQVLNSIRDYDGWVVDDFSTFRGLMGPDLGLDLGDFNLGARVALEAASVSEFRVCTQVDAIPFGCRNAQRTIDDFTFMLGLNLRPRVRYEIVRAFQITAGAGLTYFFYPLTGPGEGGEGELSFPLTGEVGVQYRF
jgi:hypothetical protein